MENEPKPLQGILLIDKPLGITSFDVIRQLQIRFCELGHRKVKMGHAGTLDPFASGLLLVAIGPATKQLERFIGQDKSYLATVRLGEATTTLDIEGEVVDQANASLITDAAIGESLQSIVGCREYSVPLYSAVKVDGKPLYAYARSGQAPPRIPIKEMCVREVNLRNIERGAQAGLVEFQTELLVSKGTYIRTLAEQLGRNLGVPSMLAGLRRLTIGEYSVDRAVAVDQVTESDIRPL